MITTIVPLDPDSPAGIAVAQGLNTVLADIQLAIDARKRAAQAQQDRPVAVDRTRRKAA